MNFIKILKSLLNKQSTPINLYEVIGSMKGIESLVKKFYEVMQSDPKAKNCLKTHPLIHAKVPHKTQEKLCDFLSGWMGGENLFVQKYGHPKMRARHSKFKIGEQEKNEWLYCMNIALESHRPKLTKKHKKIMMDSFTALAMRIQNH